MHSKKVPAKNQLSGSNEKQTDKIVHRKSGNSFAVSHEKRVQKTGRHFRRGLGENWTDPDNMGKTTMKRPKGEKPVRDWTPGEKKRVQKSDDELPLRSTGVVKA